MTRRVYLHVGAPKSGTTYLQQVLEKNRARLADAGVLVVGESHLDRVHAAMVVRQDPRLTDLPADASGAWSRLVEEIHTWSGPTAVLSYELFAGATAEQAVAAVAELARPGSGGSAGVEVHVVITARDLGTAVPSAWQERLKFALTTPLERWRPRPESAGVRAEWGWRTMDPAGVAARWGTGLPADRVHVVTVPRDSVTAGPDALWHRFAAACGLTDVPGLDLRVERSNESLGLVAAELLRRVNEVVRPPITGNREQALWLRDTLAHGVLVHLGREPIGLTDEQYDDAVTRADAARAAVSEAGYDVRGDLADLTATRPEARTPGQAGDTELLDAAVETILRLLLMVRERTRGRAGIEGHEPTGVARVTAVGRGVVRRVAAPVVDRRVEVLQRRIGDLEAQLSETRALHLRVAELADVVTELLLPAAAEDRRITASALHHYRGESL